MLRKPSNDDYYIQTMKLLIWLICVEIARFPCVCVCCLWVLYSGNPAPGCSPSCLALWQPRWAPAGFRNKRVLKTRRTGQFENSNGGHATLNQTTSPTALHAALTHPQQTLPLFRLAAGVRNIQSTEGTAALPVSSAPPVSPGLTQSCVQGAFTSYLKIHTAKFRWLRGFMLCWQMSLLYSCK